MELETRGHFVRIPTVTRREQTQNGNAKRSHPLSPKRPARPEEGFGVSNPCEIKASNRAFMLTGRNGRRMACTRLYTKFTTL